MKEVDNVYQRRKTRRAIADLRDAYKRSIDQNNRDELALLREVHQTKTIGAESYYVDLMRRSLILRYKRFDDILFQGVWYDAHPVLWAVARA